jgi:hypothetical protein
MNIDAVTSHRRVIVFSNPEVVQDGLQALNGHIFPEIHMTRIDPRCLCAEKTSEVGRVVCKNVFVGAIRMAFRSQEHVGRCARAEVCQKTVSQNRGEPAGE